MTGGFQGGYGAPGAMPPPPVPVRKSNSSACLIVGASGCGLLVVAAIIAGYVLSKRLNAGNFIDQIGSCSQSVDQIGAAIGDYKSDHNGRAPAALSALVPKYLPTNAYFTCGPKQSPLEYIAPTKNSAPDDVILKVKTLELNIMAGQNPRIYLALLNDGSVVQMQYSPMPNSATPRAGNKP